MAVTKMFMLVHTVVHKPVCLFIQMWSCIYIYIARDTVPCSLYRWESPILFFMFMHYLCSALSLGRKPFGKKVSDHVRWISKAFTSVEPPVTLECDWWFYTGECFTEPCILAPFFQEGCHKPVLGGWPPACLLCEFWLVLYSTVQQRPQYFWLMVHHREYCAMGWMGWG